MTNTTTVELIPRNTLFGNPDKANPQVSPDGTRMAYLAPVNNVLNVWVGIIGRNDYRPLTQDTERGVRLYAWAADNQHILYLQDAGGNENWRLYATNLKSGQTRDLTPFENVQARIVERDKHFPDALLVGLNKDNPQVHDYAYDRKTRTATYLFDNQPDLNKYTLATMQPITFTSRDGLTTHGYLTLPPRGDGRSLPMVLNVHGGPWARDSWGYRPDAQWFANRGYACLQVNYRASTGYGKEFMNAGDKEWGRKMHDDLVDAVNWAVDQGIANPKKVAIFGGSYGGYAALVGATFTPDLFCCAVDIVGPSNLITLIESVPEYWKPAIAIFHQRVGDPATEAEFLKSRSPLFKVDQIKISLLIGQGANDPRVKQAESEQIIAAMQSKGIPYEYMLFPDEGHGFAKPENRLKFFAAAEKFLAQHLGGRYEE